MIDPSQVEKFANAIIDSHSRNSILPSVATIARYSRQNIEFFQLGQRNILPKEFFEVDNQVENGFLGGQFGQSVVLAEENFIIDAITKRAANGEIPTIVVDKFSYESLSSAISGVVENPNHIFIPLEPDYFGEVTANWVQRGITDYRLGHHIMLNQSRVRVRWSNKFAPFKDIIVSSGQGIRIVQKRFEEIAVPKSLGIPLFSYRPGANVRLDFAQGGNQDEFDFYYRSVIGIEAIEKNSACIIKVGIRGEG